MKQRRRLIIVKAVWIGQWLFGSTTKRKDKVDIVLFVTVGEIDANGPRGAVGVPAGAMNVV